MEDRIMGLKTRQYPLDPEAPWAMSKHYRCLDWQHWGLAEKANAEAVAHSSTKISAEVGAPRKQL